MTMSNVIFIYSEAYHTITYLKFEDNLLSDLFDQLATQSYLLVKVMEFVVVAEYVPSLG